MLKRRFSPADQDGTIKTMPSIGPKIDDAFREYADLELRCHRLLTAGNEDSPEIAAAEERMEALWPTFDEMQQRSLGGMAADLNWIRRKGEPSPRGRKSPAEVSEVELLELSAAKKSEDWHRVLHFLRLCARAIPVEMLAQERGVVYDAIGFPEYARLFHEQAGVMKAAAAPPGSIIGADAACDHPIEKGLFS